MFNTRRDLREFIIVLLEEKIMTDFSKLTQDIADLSAKVDALVAKQNPPDEQPTVDDLAAKVEAIAAKIPA